MRKISESLTATQEYIKQITELGVPNKVLKKLLIQYFSIPITEYSSWKKGKEAEGNHFRIINDLYHVLKSRTEKQVVKFVSSANAILESHGGNKKCTK